MPCVDVTAGVFVPACIVHIQSIYNEGWDRWNLWHIRGRLVREVFGDWYFGRGNGKAMDTCEWPCNKDCPIFT